MVHMVASVWAPHTTRAPVRIREAPPHTGRTDHARRVPLTTRARAPTAQLGRVPTSTATGAPAPCNAAITGRRPRTRRTIVAAHRHPASAPTAALLASLKW